MSQNKIRKEKTIKFLWTKADEYIRINGYCYHIKVKSIRLILFSKFESSVDYCIIMISANAIAYVKIVSKY